MLLLLLLPDSEDPAPEEGAEAATVLIILDPPNVLVLVRSLRVSMSTVAVAATAMMSEWGMIRDVRRRDMLMGCMGSWIGSTSEDSNGGILNILRMCVIRLREEEVVVVGRVGRLSGRSVRRRRESLDGCMKVGGTKEWDPEILERTARGKERGRVSGQSE